jgi:hypothetical protein
MPATIPACSAQEMTEYGNEMDETGLVGTLRRQIDDCDGLAGAERMREMSSWALTSSASAPARIKDVAAIAELRAGCCGRAGNEAAGIDHIAVRAHRIHLQSGDEPALPDALGRTVIVLGHHRAGGRAVEEGLGSRRGKTFVSVAANAS